MKVIGAGFGRTGTSSLRASLERLGFGPCYHMEVVIKSPRNSELWNRYLDKGSFDWDEIFQGYESAVDWPVSAYYDELAARYPEAKIILTVRDPERWYESVMKTIYEIYRVTERSPIMKAVSLFVPHLRHVKRLTKEIVWDGDLDGKLEDRQYSLNRFEEHIEEVKRKIPPERLLVYEVREGWGPLCEFLGVEEPEEPFPHLNDTAEFRRRILVQKVLDVVAPTVVFAGIATLLFARLRRRRLRG